MNNFFIFIMYFIGFVLIASNILGTVPGEVAKAVMARNKVGKTTTRRLIDKLSSFILPLIKINTDRKKKIETSLNILSIEITAESHIAYIIANAIIFAIIGLLFCFLNIWIGIALSVIFFSLSCIIQNKEISKKLYLRRIEVERELPQFAGTIRQQLATTKDIVTILSTYRKVCGKTLKTEITRTINEIKTANTIYALQSLERRVGSTQLSEVVRGLIAVANGEEQTMFFEILTDDLIKAQTESIIKELQKRPSKLATNFIVTVAVVFFIAIYAMIGSIGVNPMSSLF